MKKLSKRKLLGGVALLVVAGGAIAVQALGGSGSQAVAQTKGAPGAADGLGQLTGKLPDEKLTLGSPTADENKFGQAVVNFQGAPDFSPERIATPGPDGFPLEKFQPGAVARDGYSPFIRIEGSPTVYSAPIVATGDGPFDVEKHTNTHDRALGFHIAPESPPGQYLESWVDLLFVKGFDAGEPIVYLSTDAGQELPSVLERSTYVPALDRAAYNGGDDFLGSARERLFGFVNGQTGRDNKESQGFQHLVKDGHAAEDASASNRALIDDLRYGGDLLHGFRGFPTPEGPP